MLLDEIKYWAARSDLVQALREIPLWFQKSRATPSMARIPSYWRQFLLVGKCRAPISISALRIRSGYPIPTCYIK